MAEQFQMIINNDSRDSVRYMIDPKDFAPKGGDLPPRSWGEVAVPFAEEYAIRFNNDVVVSTPAPSALVTFDGKEASVTKPVESF